MIKKLFTHTFLYAIGPQVPKLANLLVFPVITQYLTPLDYGVYGTLLAYSALMGGVKKLGFDILLVNAFYKKNTWKRHWGRYLGGLYIFNFFFSFLYFFILYTLMPEEVIEHKVLVVLLIVLPATLFDIIKMFGGRYFQLSQKPQYIAITTAITGGITVMMNLYTIAFLKLGYLGWIFSTAVGSFMVFTFYAIPVFKTLKLKMEFFHLASFD